MNVTSKAIGQGALWMHAEDAADEIGVRLYNPGESGKGIVFTLKTGEPTEMREDWRGKMKLQPKYQRLSQRARHSTDARHPGIEFYPTVPGAVCWHGHRDFLRALYRRVPDAKVRTAFITYQNAEHFEENYERTWDGAPDRGRSFAVGYVPYQDACTCGGVRSSYGGSAGLDWQCSCGASGFEAPGARRLTHCPTCNRPLMP